MAERAATADADAPAERARRKTAAPSFYVSGFWRRTAAALIDAAAITPVALLLTWLASSIAGVHLPASRHRSIDFWLDLLLTNHPAMWTAIGLFAAITVIYLALFQITMARTPGMRALKIRVIDVYGDPPAAGRALARSFGYLACVATLGLGFLWVGFDSERRGLHDWLSGTYVVRD